MTYLVLRNYEVRESGSHLCNLSSKFICYLSICCTIFCDLNGDSRALIFTEIYVMCLLPSLNVPFSPLP